MRATKAASILAEELTFDSVVWDALFSRTDRAERAAISADLAQLQQSLDRVTPKLRDAATSVRAGAGQDTPLSAVGSPKGLIASAVATGWSLAHGIEHLRPQEADMHRACECLWLAATGKRESWGRTPSGWTLHLRHVCKAVTAGELRGWAEYLYAGVNQEFAKKPPIHES